MEIIFRNHNKEFADLQKEYLSKPFKERNKEILGKMWEVCYSYSCNLLIQYTHSKSLIWADWIIQEKASDMATWLIEPYLRDEKRRIEKLSSYAHFAKLKILYADKEYEMRTVSYDSLLENGGEHYTSLADLRREN